MAFITIYAKDKHSKNRILDWLFEQLCLHGDVSLLSVLQHFGNDVTIEDHDVASYWDVGWNELDLLRLRWSQIKSDDLEIPSPSYQFVKHYT